MSTTSQPDRNYIDYQRILELQHLIIDIIGYVRDFH